MKRIAAIVAALALMVSLTSCALPKFSANAEAFSYRDLETQLNRFAEEDGVEGVLSIDTIEYPRKLQNGGLLYYVTYWDGLFSVYITELDGQVVLVQAITHEERYASRHAEKTREEWAAVAAYPFVLCENGLKKDTVGEWHASAKEKAGYVWSDSPCTYESEAWTYSWTQNESTIFITANHESYTPGEGDLVQAEDTTPLTHDVLIERLNEFAAEIGIVGVGEVTSTPKDGEGEIGYDFECFGEFVSVEVIEKDGAAVQVMAITNTATYPKELAGILGTEDFSLMAFTLTSGVVSLCETERDSEGVATWSLEKYDQATVENENGVEFRTYISDEWEYLWLMNDFEMLGKMYTCVAVDIAWADANIAETDDAALPFTTTVPNAVPHKTGQLVHLDATTPIYSGPGYHYAYLGTVGQSTNYTIVEEAYSGTATWGRLKSGRGWVCLYSSMAPGDISNERWDVNYTLYLNAGTTIYGDPSPSRAVGTVTQSTKYTIVEECINNSGRWGRLKSGLGWIDLEEWQAPPTNAPQTSPTTTRTTTRATTTTTRARVEQEGYISEEKIFD